MQPRRAEVVLLLTDLRNSTPLAELLGPAGMFKLLNQAFEAQTSAIMSEEGNLEHFLGDQFLSYWGAPQPQPGAADQAERAAIKLIEAMEKLQPPSRRKFKRFSATEWRSTAARFSWVTRVALRLITDWLAMRSTKPLASRR
jgi:class 3 adenylate cyclase